MAGVTLITPTGGRPEAFALCRKYVERQTYAGPTQWIVVDDGRAPEAKELKSDRMLITVIRPEPFWEHGQNTLARNLLAAIPEVQHDYVLVIENDDCYRPDYVERQMTRFLEGTDIVGEVPARYYHLPTRQYAVLKNSRHASLCQTGFHRGLLPTLKSVCENLEAAFIDVRLWERCPTRRVLCHDSRCVGMKGLPGRTGIGVGHRPEASPASWIPDPNLRELRSWIGDADLEAYQGLA